MAAVGSVTLVGGVAQSVTVDAPAGVLVTNTTQQGIVWARADGVAATVAGAGCFPVAFERVFPQMGSGVTVSVISATTPVVSVEGLPE